ncbi:hypothetical protein VNO77_22607 [Canavalia gladiata]|uniref:Uncharacterized protein n=1 Tax=Canavalia gladiata TaxID=3824 RepID=A0AAN9L658_CANGL
MQANIIDTEEPRGSSLNQHQWLNNQTNIGLDGVYSFVFVTAVRCVIRILLDVMLNIDKARPAASQFELRANSSKTGHTSHSSKWTLLIPNGQADSPINWPNSKLIGPSN